MSNWNELRKPFYDALVAAFSADDFRIMLRHPPCNWDLEHITAVNQKIPIVVMDVIQHAERHGWLADLATGALAANPSHRALQAVAPQVAALFARSQTDAGPDVPDPVPLPIDAELRPYLQWVVQQSEKLALSLLDPSGAKTARLALARVFINLHATLRSWQLPDDAEVTVRERAALAAVHAERRLILLGDPGSGKSTLLRFIVFCLAQATLEPAGDWLPALSWQREFVQAEVQQRRRQMGNAEAETEAEEHHWTAGSPLPVLIELRDFARTDFDPDSPLALWRYVARQLTARGLDGAAEPLMAQARSGNVIFLLDGVDEVPAAQRRPVWRAVAALADGVYGGCRWVATCRVLSYDADEAPEDVPVRTLQPLIPEQIAHFIDCWYSVLAEMGELAAARAESLSTHLQQQTQRSSLEELARNPMLLTIMAIVQTYYGTLPEERARLYQVCVETLLLRWQLPKEAATDGKALPDMLAALGVSQQKLERLLWEIAWQAHADAVARDERADIRESEIMALAARHLGGYDKAEQFLAYTEERAHLLVGRGGLGERVFAFPHRTFQEYLAACYLTPGLRLLKEAPRLAAAGDTWREVLNLAAGALVYNNNNFEQVLYAVERMVPAALPATPADELWQQIWLAGEMAAVVGRQNFEESDLGETLLPRLREQLAALLASTALAPAQRAEAGDALGKLGDRRPGVCTREPALIEIPAGPFVYGDGETVVIEEAYAISRYPVTVAQYGHFVAAGGYKAPRWWGGAESAGWRWRTKEYNPEWRGEGPVTAPEYWEQPRWHGANRPVVGVSWYEAQAYCRWLAAETGRGYRLPTEQEWERAARHTDGREWAWGSQWTDGIVNTSEAQVGRTTAVGAFPQGRAACGADDMSGNVREWTASSNSEEGIQVVRGGSWYVNRDYARVSYRYGYNPNDSYYDVGFRLVAPVF